MHQRHRRTGWRLLTLTGTVCCLSLCLFGLAGCQQLNLFSVHNPRVDPAKNDPGKPGTEVAVGASLPGKYQTRISQYLFYSDFAIDPNQPLFRELADMPKQLQKALQLPLPNTTNVIQVYLFENRDRYESFMTAKYPDLPKRRAFFVAWPRGMGSEDLLVYTYWGNGDRIEQDLRHELTHALLHSVLKDVPLWLDEGLAEYFELPPAQNGVNPDHLKHLRHGELGPVQLDLTRLEQLTEVRQMSTAEYREAWAWVHLMIHSNDETRKVLIVYLRELRRTDKPGPLKMRLTNIANFSPPELALERHLALLEAGERPTAK
jgi:Protein of unknown function (DUF1570)